MSHNIKKSKHSFKVIRRFEEDIWGVLAVKQTPSNLLQYIYEIYQNNFRYKKLLAEQNKNFFMSKKRDKFLYKITSEDREFKRKRRTLKINNYLNLLKLRKFYGGLGAKQFSNSIQNMKLPINILSNAFAYFLESRLDVVLYRANFFTSIYAARQYINHKKVYVNGICVNKSGYKLKVGDIVSISNPLLFYKQIKKRLEQDLILGNYPSYLEVNYKIGAIIFCKFPKNSEVPYPFFVDIEQLANSFTK